MAYANKYAGAAWGAGNNHRYNQSYLDYTSRGGDCTNFASQVIGDKKAGGLPMTYVWRSGKSGGTQSWVRTDSFSHFILNNGYGKLVSKGDFQHIVSPTKDNPNGAVSQLLPGDLIGYIIKGSDVDHFSIVVGHDDYGYPLVNSHTADRYRVPFDLGWDKYTKYLLIHIKD
ncbi:putative amidase domain protein [compost metagenome]